MMICRVALLVLLTATAAGAQPARYPSELVRVVDGDTYIMRMDLGFGVSYTASIRLADVDAHERFTVAGKAASLAVGVFLRSGAITVEPTGDRTFERYVARVYVDGKPVADFLIAGGHKK